MTQLLPWRASRKYTTGQDGFAGVTGTGTIVLRPIDCVNKTLIVSADVAAGGRLRIGIVGSYRLGLDTMFPITEDVTREPVHFVNGTSFSGHIGKAVTLEVELTNATLYAVGWA